jgi:hypothetical protein
VFSPLKYANFVHEFIIMRLNLVLLFILVFKFFGQSQEIRKRGDENRLEFRAAQGQKYGFDAAKQGGEQYTRQGIWLKGEQGIPVKSVAKGASDLVYLHIAKTNKINLKNLRIRSLDDNKEVPFLRMNDSTLTIFLPEKQEDYDIVVQWNGRVSAKLRVMVLDLKLLKLKVVPLIPFHENSQVLANNLNKIFIQANIAWEVEVAQPYRLTSSALPQRLSNPDPSYARYTNEMQEIRDDYFEHHPNADRHTYYVFVTPGFVNGAIKGYQPLNKAIGFVSMQSAEQMTRELAIQLARGQGMLKDYWTECGSRKGRSSNLMDCSSGKEMSAWQWTLLRHGSNSYSYFDDYEDVVSSSGRVAAVFWEENKKGYILLTGKSPLTALKRPFKRNYMTYELNITNSLYIYLFSVAGISFAGFHLLSFSVLLVIYFFVHRAFFRWKNAHKLPFRFLDIFWGAIAITVFMGLNVMVFIMINQTYEQFLVKNGVVPSYAGKNKEQVIAKAKHNRRMKNRPEFRAVTEVIFKTKRKWHVKKMAPVLYFEFDPAIGRYGALMFLKSSNRLRINDYGIDKQVDGHYIVVRNIGQSNETPSTRVYNHLGIELTSKLKLADPPKRILLFVNGYRATTRGHNFEEFYSDIFKFGLEHPNSENLIYSFDRFDYWRPWEEIDLLFQRRINPSDTYYADGHFSVTTSNHRSLFNFTTTSGMYPRRCLNKKKHTCYYTNISSTRFIGHKKKSTYELLPKGSNKGGFRERVNNGKLAGLNLFQQFNEVPNGSKNDTLYVVAHSMGYAYALGIIEHLRGKIHFGGFYIIAPENASSGEVRLSEWQEVWQYGSNLENGKAVAPCLQDGIAPQVKCGGLPTNNRVFFPRNRYRQQGFFDSHFIGYYTWIFDIPKKDRGYVRQR